MRVLLRKIDNLALGFLFQRTVFIRINVSSVIAMMQ